MLQAKNFCFRWVVGSGLALWGFVYLSSCFISPTPMAMSLVVFGIFMIAAALALFLGYRFAADAYLAGFVIYFAFHDLPLLWNGNAEMFWRFLYITVADIFIYGAPLMALLFLHNGLKGPSVIHCWSSSIIPMIQRDE